MSLLNKTLNEIKSPVKFGMNIAVVAHIWVLIYDNTMIFHNTDDLTKALGTLFVTIGYVIIIRFDIWK